MKGKQIDAIPLLEQPVAAGVSPVRVRVSPARAVAGSRGPWQEELPVWLKALVTCDCELSESASHFTVGT